MGPSKQGGEGGHGEQAPRNVAPVPHLRSLITWSPLFTPGPCKISGSPTVASSNPYLSKGPHPRHRRQTLSIKRPNVIQNFWGVCSWPNDKVCSWG